MDHKQAAETQAVERYLLGHLPAEERDAFEEHFFTCAECAEGVKTGARFQANARAVLEYPDADFRPQAEPRRAAWWRFPALAPLAVSALLMGAVVYQAGFQVPGLHRQLTELTAARVVPEFMVHEATRGGASLGRIPAGSGPFRVRFDLFQEGTSGTYDCTFTDAGGKVIDQVPVPAPQGADPVRVELNHARYPAGRYTITVRASGGVISQYSFEME